MKKILMMLLCATLWWSCAEDAPENPVGKIVGSVSDYSVGDPISVVNVVLTPGNKSTVTGTDGTFSFENIAAGEYTITISKEGYKSTQKSVEVETGKSTECHLLLERIPAIVTADTDVLNFGADKGVSALSFSIVNSSYEDLEWEAQWDCSWIKEVNPRSGVLRYGKTATIVVLIDRELLNGGENSTVIVIRSLNGNGSSEVKVYAEGEHKDTPVMNTMRVEDIKTTSAIFTGEVIQPGTSKYTERGFVYSTKPIDTKKEVNEFYYQTSPVSENKTYDCFIENLLPGRTYYIRAYARNKFGLAYSTNEISFTTCTQLTAVQTYEPDRLYMHNGRAILKGEITTVGSPTYSEKGFCVNTTGEPTINDKKFPVTGTSGGKFDYNFILDGNSDTYHIRAYAIQNGRVEYGDVQPLSLSTRPTVVTTLSSTDYTDMGIVTLNGMIVDEGNPCFYEKGFCYATHNNPTIKDEKMTQFDTERGNFSSQIWLEKSGVTYYYRAYAMQNGEAVYGSVMPISKDNRMAEVITVDRQDISASVVVLYGNVTDAGHPYIEERGIEYGTTSTYSSNWKKKADMYRKTGEYAIEFHTLSEGTNYYYRAYVIQDGQVVPGQIREFKTYQMPLIYTEPIFSSLYIEKYAEAGATYYKVKLIGMEAKAGYPACTEYGFVYGTKSDIKVGSMGAVTLKAEEVYTESSYKMFNYNLKRLYPNTTYYFRAYAVCDGKYYYGDVESFETGGY